MPHVEVYQKSVEELKQARACDKNILEKAKEDTKMQYEEKLKSHVLIMKKEMVKEAKANISDMFAQNTQPPTSRT
ncbi:hypothetical protein Tco_0851050 [Tanacetum coccineum]